MRDVFRTENAGRILENKYVNCLATHVQSRENSKSTM